ncbi:MAG: NAD(P)/FAD-dependent oxidoreductase [Gammaproteobacteria bacterium]
MRVDFLIVGQGLAGSLLGWELLQRGARVLLLDAGGTNASQVAAGLINPITGMRLVKTPGIDALLPEAAACYRQLEQRFGKRFYIEKPLLRRLANERERHYAEQRCADGKYRDYIDRFVPENDAAPFGSLLQQRSAYLLTAPLLSCLRDFFHAGGSYQETALRYADLALTDAGVCWRDVNAQRLVFCEGYRSKDNPWFGRLPLQPVKGEILTLQAGPLPDTIVNYGQWLIPLDAHTARIGATFERECLDCEATDSAKQQLLANLSAHCPAVNIHAVIDHQAGIRPATLDKQPFLGAHPRHPQLTIFNGFGAKGSLAIPYYARHFAEFLLHGAPLSANADIRRHAAHFPG